MLDMVCCISLTCGGCEWEVRERILIMSLAILFLASKEARWITGLIMPVDGGVSIFFVINSWCLLMAYRQLLAKPIDRL